MDVCLRKSKSHALLKALPDLQCQSDGEKGNYFPLAREKGEEHNELMKSVIYEVNLKIEKVLESKMLEWLDHHIEEMESVEGFLKNTRVFRDTDSEMLHLSVHYQLESMSAMDNYLKNHAEEMRSRLPDEWRPQIEFSRRILEDFSLV